MSSRGKKKTTFAKLSRESRLRERRLEKAARKEARKLAPPEPELTEPLPFDADFDDEPDTDGDAAVQDDPSAPVSADSQS